MYKETSKFKAYRSQFKAQGSRLKAAFALLFYLFTFLPLPSAAQEVLQRSCRMRPVRQAGHLSMRAAQNAQWSMTNMYVGERRQLVILVSFSDKDFSAEDPVALWNDIFNTEDYSEGSYCGSIHDYFLAQSYGQLDITFDLLHLTVGELARYHSTASEDENSQFLVNDIADQLEAMDIDWSLYDWNDDDYVDQLLIVYAGKGRNDGGGNNTIWPHQWWLSEHIDPDTKKNCQPRTVTTADGSTYTIDAYCAIQEQAGITTRSTFGTICHEYSHCFGFPDFYNGSTSYVSRWDLMDFGNNNGNGYRPCNYSAHERWLMGWLIPTELSHETSVTGMAPLSDKAEAYLIRNNGKADEYYLVENRQPTGWDADLPGSGLVVFHVDYDVNVWTGVTVATNSSTQKRYTIFPANNRTQTSYAAGWAYPYEDNDQLTDESAPAATLFNANSDGSKLMHKPLTNMLVSDGMASFDFMGGTTAISTPEAAENTPKFIFRYGPISFVRTADGSVKKVINH